MWRITKCWSWVLPMMAILTFLAPLQEFGHRSGMLRCCSTDSETRYCCNWCHVLAEGHWGPYRCQLMSHICCLNFLCNDVAADNGCSDFVGWNCSTVCDCPPYWLHNSKGTVMCMSEVQAFGSVDDSCCRLFHPQKTFKF